MRYSTALWKYTNLRIEEVPGFRYVEHTVISNDPESDALDRVYKIAKENGDNNPKGLEVKEPKAHKYVAIYIDRPFDNPFVTIPGAYGTLNDYI